MFLPLGGPPTADEEGMLYGRRGCSLRFLRVFPGWSQVPLTEVSQFRKLLMRVRFALATQAITYASSINPSTGTESGMRSNGLTKYRTAETIDRVASADAE